MSRRRRNGLTPSLFPFLAVLVCTLGMLILLLALVAQNAADDAKRIAESLSEDPLAELTYEPGPMTVKQVNELIEEEAFRLSELVSFRDAQTADLETRRNQLAHVEDHARRIRKQLRSIGQAMQQTLENDQTNPISDELIQSLEKERDQKSKTIEKLRDEVSTETPRVVIVPHQGPNGTSRRPIYLECTADGITIEPGGVTLTLDQLLDSSRDANPLDDALRAIRYHAMQTYGDTEPPYPLFVIRPNGITTYYAARGPMTDWDDQFGYELVSSDLQLAYPETDGELKERVQFAVDEALKKLSKIRVARAFADRQRRGSGTGHAPGGSNGSRAGSGSRSGRSLPPRLSASQLDRERRINGFNDHRMYPSGGYGNNPNEFPLSQQGYPGGPGSSFGQRTRRNIPYGSSDPQTAGEQIGAHMESAETFDLTEFGQTRRSEITATEGAERRQASSAGEYSSPGSRQIGSTENGSLQRVGKDSSGGTQGNGGRTTYQAPRLDGSSGSNAAASTRPSMSFDSTQQPNQNGSPQNLSLGMNQGAPQSSTASTQSQRRPQMRKNWALPRALAEARGNDIVRPIRLQLYPDRLVLLPGAGSRVAQTFPIRDGDLDVATLQMAEAIGKRIEQWGYALPGGRWAPRLRTEVMPGAETRFTHLQRLMSGSGIPVENIQSTASGASGRTDR